MKHSLFITTAGQSYRKSRRIRPSRFVIWKVAFSNLEPASREICEQRGDFPRYLEML